ncbi:MAG TPA: ABC transporter substrate-binding protein [Acidimicrobiales bacterium]|nr:ABC transporter substrate-binding protein [Acidimicrobiales bacterium]
MRKALFGRCALGAAISLTGSVCLGAAGGSAASASSSPITIGFISDITGVAASTFQDSPGGAQARIALQNAQGGVDGHKIKLVVEDDQSSPSTNQTVSEDLVQNKGAFGVIDYSAFTFGGYKYLQQQGIPVTGGGFDGPEWNAQPNVNMFDTAPPLDGLIDGSYYAADPTKIYKSLGIHKVAGLAYGISQSSQQSIKSIFSVLPSSKCYENLSVPFGGVDFTADVLQVKQAGCDTVIGSFVDASDIALSQAVKNAGIKAKQIYFTGYDQNVLGSPNARAAADGDYFTAAINFTTPNTATQDMLKALKKYDPSYKGGIPDYGLYGAYLSADLMIKGLELAGKNPTRSAFITNLRKVKSYNAGGILPGTTLFTGFGTAGIVPKTLCGYYMQLKGTQFHVVTGKAICGKAVPVAPS